MGTHQAIIRYEQAIAARITVYAGENEQHYSYITPETLKALQEWMDYRTQAGEQITPDSWVMRDLWDTSFPSGGGFATAPKKYCRGSIGRLHHHIGQVGRRQFDCRQLFRHRLL
jgi:hypothetical protein